ncbi:putative Ig domain-containing protein [Pseudomonas sp. Z4-20]
MASPPKLRAVIGEAFSYTIPKDLIIDPNVGDTVFYSVEGFNGEALPAWLNFNRDTRTLSGTPSAGDQGIPRLFLWGRDNYGAGTAYDLVLNVTGPNHNPTLNAQISDQSLAEGLAFTYSIPSNTFSDSDAGDSLTLTATLEDGSPLPSWLTYNPTNNTFSGIPPAGAVGATTVLITARDTMGAAATDIFKFITTIQNLTINGTSSNDTLSGRSGNDTINGGNGNDLLYGRDGNDRLDGGSGNDTMFGGAGNDVYVVNSALDVLNENANEGSDTAESSITYTLSSNIENLILTGTTAINGTGNTLANTLTGNSAINTLTGAAGNDTLDGKGGADKLIGGTGDDVYIVDNVGDVITELLNEGIDSVQSSVTYTLATNAENLTLLGTTAINGTGNSLNNFLQGNSAANTLMGGAGNDRLDGLAGSDKLVGGAGDDTYVIDSTGDTVTENANEGIDTVETSITYTLGSNLENITLSGSNAINATGNSLNNTITGNQGNNILSGGAGNDVLIGNAGSDTLNGGTGNDTYQLSRGFGSDTLVDSDATSGNLDSVYFMNDIMSDQLWFSKAAGSNDLKIAVIGTSDNFLIKDWYVSSANHVEQLKSADGKTLTDSNVQNLVNAMASFSPPAQGETTLSASYHTALDATIAANWK